MTPGLAAGTDGACGFFSVVDDGDGDGVAPLQFAQEGEQWGDIAADILVDAMHEQARFS